METDRDKEKSSKKAEGENGAGSVPLSGSATFDQDLYGPGDRFSGYEKTIPVEEEDGLDERDREMRKRINAAKAELPDRDSGEVGERIGEWSLTWIGNR